jgi:hypothetical protein
VRYKDVFERLNGREPTVEQTLKFERLVATLETTPGDAMLSVLVALDHYETLYNRIPARIKDATQSAAISAADAAQAEVSGAVAALLPTITAAISDSAAEAVRRITLGKSVVQMWMAIVMLGIMFAAGWMGGSGILAGLQSGSIRMGEFWGITVAGIGVGSATPALLILALYSTPGHWIIYVATALATSLSAILACKILGVF